MFENINTTDRNSIESRETKSGIECLEVAFPSLEVSNDILIQMIREKSPDLDERFFSLLKRQLKKSGLETRKWLANGESSLDITLRACRSALERGPNIDMLISCSVDRELVEPSSANLLASKLGLNGVESFDLVAACDGFMKGVKIAQALISSGACSNILLVNAEFPLTHSRTKQDLFRFTSLDELEYRFPALTIGECATATILTKAQDKWISSNTTKNELYDECTITQPWYGEHPISPKVARDGAGNFTSYGRELKKHGFPAIVAEFKKSNINPDEPDIVFTHSSSKSDWADATKEMSIAASKIYDIYKDHGNVVSAAIPAAMAMALKENRLKRGDKVLCLVASAGMSFSLSYFTF